MKYRNLFCSMCNDYTKHSVEDDAEQELQTIKCIKCGESVENQIVTKRVKVEKKFYDRYTRRKAEFERKQNRTGKKP